MPTSILPAPETSAAHPAVYQFDPEQRCWVTQPNPSVPLPQVPALEGSLLIDRQSLREAADDFGHLIHRMPLAILRPASVEDVVRMVRFANQHAIKLVGRGQGHTAFGQAQVEAGIILDLRSLCRMGAVEKDRVRVDAGVIWRDLILHTTAVGLTPPVLTDYTNLTVGGTLSVGGVSGRSFRYGTQVDQVLELEVVTGQGELLICSPSTHPDLFYGVLAGLGQCGLMVGATLRLIPARRFARTYRFFYPGVESMLANLRHQMADGEYDYLRGNAVPTPPGPPESEGSPAMAPPGPFVFFLEATRFYDTPSELPAEPVGEDVEVEDRPYFEFTDQVVQLIAQLDAAGLGQLPHPWLDLFVPGSRIDAFASQTIAHLDPATFLPGSLMLFYPFVRERLTCPLLRVPEEDQFFLFDILRTLPADSSTLLQTLAQNRQLYEQNRENGGFPYTISAVAMEANDWMGHFGSYWTQLESVKQHHDPRNVLGGGLRLFDTGPVHTSGSRTGV